MRAEQALAAALTLAAAGCMRVVAPPPPPTPPAPLPVLGVAQVVSEPVPPAPADVRGAARDPLGAMSPGPPISLSAASVDVRTLLPALAEAAGVSLVLGPEVQGRVSVNLVEVPALEALRAVLEQAGLSLASGPPEPPFGPVVFYVLPVDIETASAETIQRRFGVSAEVARWIVQTRLPR